MKKILLIILAIGLCFAQANAGLRVIVAGGVTAAPAGNSDTFTGSQAALATHDAHWTASADGAANLEIDGSGSLRLTGNYRNGSAYYDGSTSDVSQLVVKAGSADAYFQARACVRMSSTVRGYCFALIENDGDNWTDIVVFKNNAVLCYLAGSYDSDTDRTVKIKASGTGTVTINAYVDGSEVTSGCTDSTSPYNSGAPGIFLNGGSSADYANNKVDNWQDYE